MDEDLLKFLVIGKHYSRKEIGEKFGGNYQKGITYAKKINSVLVFTGSNDHPDEIIDNVLHYHGAGKKGDQLMDSNSGNLTLRNTLEDGSRIFLFKKSGKSGVDYVGEVRLVEEPKYVFYEPESRQKYIFQLMMIDDVSTDDPIELEKRAESFSYLDLNALKERIGKGNSNPERLETTTIKYKRDPRVVQYALKRSKGFCELCEKPAPFLKPNGDPYLEVHHIHHLADGGPDIIQNVAALCANCHRKMHVLSLKKDIDKLKQIENNY